MLKKGAKKLSGNYASYLTSVAFKTIAVKNDRIEKELLDEKQYKKAITIVKKGVAGTISLNIKRDNFLDSWSSGGVGKKSLSERIYSNIDNFQKEVIASINDKMAQINSWQSLSRKVNIEMGIKAELPKYIDRLAGKAKVALDGNIMAVKSYKKELQRVEEQIRKLASNGAPTSRLKNAYSNIIKATESKKQIAIDNAINRAVKAKAQYYADRLARTEIASAYSESMQIEMTEDQDAIGYRSVLSSRHAISDICDFYANVDLYGLGAGCFPKTSGPPLPYHPNCLCSMEIIYKPRQQGKDVSRYIDGLSKDKINAMFGKNSNIKDNPNNWRDKLNNYVSFESKVKNTIDK